MLQHFFKIAFRNMARHKGFTLINIAGLTLGLTACLLIGLFVWDEYQYDNFLPDGDRIYRVYEVQTTENGREERSVSPPMIATTLQQEFPQVEKVGRVMMLPVNKSLFETGGKQIYEESGYLTDSTFFDLFPLELKYGKRSGILDDPKSIAISSDLASRLFGNEDPVGKTIMKDKSSFKVTAVFVGNTKFHLSFNYIIPVAAAQLPADRMQSWGWQQFYNYVKLKPGANVKTLEARFQAIAKERGTATSKGQPYNLIPHFQQLSRIHLYSSNFKFELPGKGNITYVRALTIIAIFILLIACFNFINLATAKAMQRGKEVGVRRAIGALRKQLMMQFIGETVLMLFLSISLAVALAIILLPVLNQFTNKTIALGVFGSPAMILTLILTTLLVGILAGFYPAFMMSGFKPIKVLKASGSAAEGGHSPWLRQSLVVTQFTLSILLIICALVVYNQVNYLHNKDLGFNKDQVMFFPMRSDTMFKRTESFKNELHQLPGVESVSIGYGYPGDAVAGDEFIYRKNGQLITQNATQIVVDYDYIKTLGLKIIAGRDFSRGMSTDADHAYIVNETAAKLMGFNSPEKALGEPLYWHPWDGNNPDSLKSGSIIGVVKDFNYKSLYDKVEPTVIQIYPQAAWKVAVKIKTAGIDNTIEQVRKVWNNFSPEFPLEYKFLDENFEQMYKSEDKLKSLLWLFTGIAIFVGCMGLFGLAAYTAERRKKEVGIRKVLGASVEGMVILLSRDFIILVLLSILIASPLAWMFMNRWLQDFAYRIQMSGWVFLIAGLLAILIAFFTVSFQAIKVALNNPVNSLRGE